MTTVYRGLCYAVISILLLACSSAKKVTLEPITVSANKPGADIYRGSYTRLTDIIHTRLDLKFNWDSSLVIGRAFIDAKPYFYPSDEIKLNARGFRINQVALFQNDDYKPLKYTYDRKALSIKLDKVYQNTEKFTVFIDYTAMPAQLKIGADIPSEGSRGFFFINPDGRDKGKPRQFWTQGETEWNSAWFPTIDGPQEKMTQEISMTVPNGMVTLSNGTLDFSSDNGDGTHTDTWRQEQPHATYLTMVAGGTFDIVKDSWRNKEVSYYMEPEYAPHARLIFGKTPEMIEFFSQKLGVDYPWDKYSQIVVRDFVSGAMENTTASVFFDRMNMTPGQYQDESYEDIVSHELFHHWFGDLVTTESWANLPLNESFATYGEYLWNEHKYGRDFADYGGWKDQEAYLNSERARDEDVIRFGYANASQMFDLVSYQKGGRILHMLRRTVGDEAFFESLKLYLKKHSFKTAEIHDLRLAFEEITGQDLNWFFNQWFLASGHPRLKIESSYDSLSKKLNVNILQQQNLQETPLYRLPLAIDIYQGGQVTRQNVVLSRESQTFSFDVTEAPALVNVDAEKYLLAEKSETKTVQEYVYQYTHAPLFLDRYEAIDALERMAEHKEARQTLTKALGDKNWGIRRRAVEFCGKLPAEEKAAVYNTLKQMALNDERSYVRAAAISMLKKAFASHDNKEVFSKAQTDEAPSVQDALKRAG